MRLFIYEIACAGAISPQWGAALRQEGSAMLRAMAGDFARIADVHVTTMVDETCPTPPGHACLRVPPSQEVQTYRECAAGADATLVIAPEFDDFLAERSQWVLDVGGHLLGSLPPAIALAADKLGTHGQWRRQGVRTPDTVIATAASPDAFGPPWVCKPCQGAGSQAVFLVRDAADWPAAFVQASAEWPDGDLIAQPWITGTAASVAFLIGPAQVLPLPPATQNLSDNGRVTYHGGQVPLPARLCTRAVQLGRAALAGIDGLQGYVGVDLVLGAAADGSQDYAIEINPRLTTSYVGLRQLCRGNLAKAWLDIIHGSDVRLQWDDGVIEFTADGACPPNLPH